MSSPSLGDTNVMLALGLVSDVPQAAAPSKARIEIQR
jgi:hypothetical protein